MKKSQDHVFDWYSPDDDDIRARVEALETVTIAYSGSHSSGSACEGKAGGGGGDNVAVLTGSFPHKPQLSNGFSEGSLGDGTVFEGGNALHTAFRKVAREQQGITLRELDKALLDELKRQDAMRDSRGGPYCCNARHKQDDLIYQVQKDTCTHEVRCADGDDPAKPNMRKVRLVAAPVTDHQFTMALTDASVGETNDFKMVACSVDARAACREAVGGEGEFLWERIAISKDLDAQNKYVYDTDGFNFYPFVAGALDHKVSHYFPLQGLGCEHFEGVEGKISVGADDKFSVVAECEKLMGFKEQFGFRGADECCASRLMEQPLATFKKVKDVIAKECAKEETVSQRYPPAPRWQIAGFRTTAQFTGHTDCWAAYLSTADDDAKWKVDLENRFTLGKPLYMVSDILQKKDITCPGG